MQSETHRTAPRLQRSSLVSIALFLILAVTLGTLWAWHARSAGMLGRPDTAGRAAWIAQLSVLLAAAVAMLVASRGSFGRVGWHFGPPVAYAVTFLLTVVTIGVALGLSLLLGALVYQSHVPLRRAPVILVFLFGLSTCFAFAEEFG